MTKDETSKYTILLPDGKSLQFVFPHGSQIGDHPPLAGPDAGRAGPLRDFGARLVGLRHRSPRSRFRPTAARAGRRRRCRSRSCRRRSRVSAYRGAGTAARRCCKAARPMNPAMSSRRAPQLHRRARRPGRSTISTASPAGRRRQGGGRSMSTRNVRRLCLRARRCLRPAAALAEGPNLGRVASARGNCVLGHQHRSRRRRPAAGQRDAASRAKRSMSQNASPATARRGPANRMISWSAGIGTLAPATSAGEDGRQLLALCHDAVRLRPPRDAVQRVEVAEQ